MSDYEECPFCDMIFETDAYTSMVHQHPLEEHLRAEHHKVKVRKGSNYRWIDMAEVESRLARSKVGRIVVTKGK
jgi:hypothetical protein